MGIPQEQTYLPADLDAALLAALDIQDTHPDVTGYLLTLPESGVTVALPQALAQVLRQAAHAMNDGLAVTVRPQTQELTTSQVADLLGVTRPTVVKLLEAGAIAFAKVGSHRRVALPDALAYRDQRRHAQYEFIAESQVDDEPPREQTLADLKRIRQDLAERRTTTNA